MNTKTGGIPDSEIKTEGIKLYEISVFLLKPMTLIQLILLFVLLTSCHITFAQKPFNAKVTNSLVGAVTVSNNGISFIPAFLLGKPSCLFVRTKEGAWELVNM